MLLKIFFNLLFMGFTSAQLDVRGCGISGWRQSRITGGDPAEATDYPWMVFLEIDYGKPGWVSHCGGAILNHHWIVTAAHCVNASVMNTSKAYVGLQYRNERNATYVQELGWAKIVIHRKFWTNSFMYDIALIKTRKPIDIEGSNGHVNGICLPEYDSPYPTGRATVIGWGCTDPNYEFPDSLHSVVLHLSSEDICKKYLGDTYRTTICVKGEKKGVCFGDSGGPLFQTDKEGRVHLIGIAVAITFTPDSDESFSTFTKVSAFRNWMDKQMT